MLSILDVKRKLPKDFIDKLYEQYTPLTVDKILKGMSGNRNTTLRVNTIKYNIRELMSYLKQNNIKFERVEWYNDALIIKNVNEKQILHSYIPIFFFLRSTHPHKAMLDRC